MPLPCGKARAFRINGLNLRVGRVGPGVGRKSKSPDRLLTYRAIYWSGL